MNSCTRVWNRTKKKKINQIVVIKWATCKHDWMQTTTKTTILDNGHNTYTYFASVNWYQNWMSTWIYQMEKHRFLATFENHHLRIQTLEMFKLKCYYSWNVVLPSNQYQWNLTLKCCVRLRFCTLTSRTWWNFRTRFEHNFNFIHYRSGFDFFFFKNCLLKSFA